MQTVNQNFAAAAAEHQSAYILAVFHFADGDVFISDRSVTPPDGPAFSGLVTEWVASAIAYGGLFSIAIPGLEIEIANSGIPPFSTLIESCDPENTEVELFTWFEGTDYADKEAIGKFKIASPLSSAKNGVKSASVSYGENSVRLSLAGTLKDRDRQVGEVISRDAWPNAEPHAIGKIEKIIYGSVKNVPCPAVSVGAVTTLVSDITPSQTDGIELSLAPGEMAFPPSGILQVGEERISYTGFSGKILTGVSRAADGTQAFSHNKGAKVFEVMNSYDYLVAGHPVQSIGDVYVDGVRVTSGVTAVTNDGNGKAKLSFSDKFILEKSVDLSVSQGSHSHQNTTWSGQGSQTASTRWTASINPDWTAGEHIGNAFMDSGGNYFYIVDNGANYVDVRSINGYALASGSYAGTIIQTQTETLFQDAVQDTFDAPAAGDAYALCDKGLNDFGAIIVSDGYIDTVRSFLATDRGYIVGAKLCAAIGQATYDGIGQSTVQGGIFSGAFVQGGGSYMQTCKTADTIVRDSAGAVSWSDFSNMAIRATFYSGTAAAAFFEQWIEVTYAPYHIATPASGVALSGRSAADYVIGNTVSCDVDGNFDDAYGTYTGAPNALIENPADVISHFLVNYLGMPSSEIDGSFASARSSLAGAIAGGYTFAGIIDAAVDGFKFIEKLLQQSRLAMMHDGYAAKLRFLSDSPQPVNLTVETEMVPMGSLKVARTARNGLINSLALHYQRDFIKGAKSAGYLSVCSSSALYPYGGDPVSVSKYGEMIPVRTFFFDFVVSDSQASDLRDFYITRYKDIKRRIEFFTFLDCFGVEPGDIISFDWPTTYFSLSGAQFFVEEVSVMPGSFKKRRPDLLRLIVREV
ncbi:MAG: hypothetical protein ACYDFU_07985 [Nitrospirota bacterium]